MIYKYLHRYAVFSQLPCCGYRNLKKKNKNIFANNSREIYSVIEMRVGKKDVHFHTNFNVNYARAVPF